MTITVFPGRLSGAKSVAATLASACFALSLLAPARVEAQRTYDNPREMYMLPEFCKYTQDFRDRVPGGNDRGQQARWAELMGPVFVHLHHYCWALMATNRANFMSRTPQERQHNLFDSLGDFDYVIQRSPKDFGLLPEIYTHKGENLLQMERVSDGMAALEHAIELKSEYWEAYAAISDYYRNKGQLGKAREWAEKGLAVAPGTMPLTRRLAQIDAAQGKGRSDPQRSVVR
jgi:tetratricopeptide (TPR) repeat protein